MTQDEKDKEIERLKAIVDKIPLLFDAIKHGSDEHKKWLHSAILSHFAGFKIPEYKE